jgi:hypothetical protein
MLEEIIASDGDWIMLLLPLNLLGFIECKLLNKRRNDNLSVKGMRAQILNVVALG